MSSVGPLPALPTLQDVEDEANSGSLETGQIVYVLEIEAYAIVWKAAPFTSIVTRLIFPDLVTFETETENQPNYTPGVVIVEEGKPPVGVIAEDCGTIFTQKARLPGSSLRTGNNEPTYTSLDHQWESGIEPIDDPPTIDAATVS